MVTRSILRPVLRPVTRAVSDTIRGFNPRSLFASGEQGIWLDPSDFSTLFQDAAGTTPVTAVGQPVGLALDKRLGLALGAELVVNGTFTGGGTGWANPDTAPSVTTFTGGVATMVAAPGFALARLRQSLTLPAGTYEVSVRVVSISGTPSAALAIGNTSSGDTTYTNFSMLSAGVYTRKVAITGPTLGLAFTASNVAGGTIVIDDVSVKLLPGNHAYQTTSASRPTLQQDSNGLYYLSFDGTDDRMQFVTQSATSLSGTAHTVILGIKLVGALPLTTQPYLSRGVSDWYIGTSVGKKWLTSHSSATPTQKTLAHGAALTDEGAFVTSFRWLTSGSNVTVGVRSNKVQQTPAVAMPLTDGYGAASGTTWQIGAFAPTGTPFPANRLYGLIVRNDYTSDGQIAATEAWMNSKTRAY